MDTATQPVIDVSIEIAAPGQSGSRPLARGILLSGQAVMVPDPPAELRRPSETLSVVVGPATPGGTGQETIAVASVTRLRLKSADLNSACAVLFLARSTQYGQTVRRCSLPQLMLALRSHQGKLWDVMAALGRTSAAGQERGTPTDLADEEDGPWDYETDSAKLFSVGVCNTCHCCSK